MQGKCEPIHKSAVRKPVRKVKCEIIHKSTIREPIRKVKCELSHSRTVREPIRRVKCEPIHSRTVREPTVRKVKCEPIIIIIIIKIIYLRKICPLERFQSPSEIRDKNIYIECDKKRAKRLSKMSYNFTNIADKKNI